MGKSLKVGPIDGFVVVDPISGDKLSGPTEVPDNKWWRSRIREGTIKDLSVRKAAPEQTDQAAPEQNRMASPKRKTGRR